MESTCSPSRSECLAKRPLGTSTSKFVAALRVGLDIFAENVCIKFFSDCNKMSENGKALGRACYE